MITTKFNKISESPSSNFSAAVEMGVVVVDDVDSTDASMTGLFVGNKVGSTDGNAVGSHVGFAVNGMSTNSK